MTTMGRRKLAKLPGREVDAPYSQSGFAGTTSSLANVIVGPFTIQPVATLGLTPPPPGLPIMREGFITETGLLPPRTDQV